MLDFESLGELIQSYIPLLSELEPRFVATISIFMTVTTVFIAVSLCLVWLRRKISTIKSRRRSRPNRTQRKLESRLANIELEKSNYELLATKAKTRALKRRARYEKPFQELSATIRIRDGLSAVFASFSPAEALTSELQGFRRRIGLVGDSFVGDLKSTLSQLNANLVSGPKTIDRAKITATKQISEDIEGIIENMDDFKNAAIEEDQTDRETENNAESLMQRWEKHLGRTAYIDKFNIVFEDMKRWLEQQNKQNQNPETSTPEYKESDSVRDTIRLFANSRLQALFKVLSTPRGFLKSFPFLVLPPEIAYSFSAFNVLANGDLTASISSTFVFSFGLFTLGQITGIALTRSRYRAGEIEKSVSKWRPLTALTAVALLLFGCGVVYIGAGLRGTTGEIIRLKQEIVHQQELQAPPQAISETKKRMEDLVEHPHPPLEKTEGQVALFIYSIFYISVIASRIFGNDPVFEFGLATAVFNEARQMRLYNRWGYLTQLLIFRSILLSKQKEKIQIEGENFQDDNLAERERLKQEIDRIENMMRDYNEARLRFFANTLAKIRRNKASLIKSWLDVQISGTPVEKRAVPQLGRDDNPGVG